jgi:BirA family biotin operon repressor/biotin-[acetyl-CoA-carboxylase] ligase
LFKIPTSTVFLGKNLVYLPECASTNSFATDLTSNKNRAAEGTVVITSRQFQGRGQRGNAWEAEEGANLTFSIVLYPQFLQPDNQFALSKAMSLGVADALADLGIPDAAIKWPNDIMIVDRKVCGILIESQVRGSKLSQSVVGIGLNVNQVAFKVPNATSVALVTGRKHDLNDLLAALLSSLEVRYRQLESSPARLSVDYVEQLYWRNQPHLFEASGNAFEGTIEDVDEAGRLRVSSLHQVSAFAAKEIVYIR